MLNIASVKFLARLDEFKIMLFKLSPLDWFLFVASAFSKLSGGVRQHPNYTRIYIFFSCNVPSKTYSSQNLAKARIYFDMSVP